MPHDVPLGLLGEVAVDLVPVVMGDGRPYFGRLCLEDVPLGDPTVCIAGDRVTHLVAAAAATCTPIDSRRASSAAVTSAAAAGSLAAAPRSARSSGAVRRMIAVWTRANRVSRNGEWRIAHRHGDRPPQRDDFPIALAQGTA